jgi:RNA polymerase sigma-70 factor (ECF subfamily)
LKRKGILTQVYQDIHTEIIELSKAGNSKAQFELYSRYSKALFNVCLRLMNKKEDAEDALQDSFCEIFDKLDSFRFEASFGSWARRVTINTCINKLNRRNPQLVFFDSLYETGGISEDNEIDEIHLRVERINKAVSMLPDGYRLILTLYLFEGYDHGEISEILGISESTSKTQYMKAKKKVKEILSTQL